MLNPYKIPLGTTRKHGQKFDRRFRIQIQIPVSHACMIGFWMLHRGIRMAWAISGAYQNKCQFDLLSSGWICRLPICSNRELRVASRYQNRLAWSSTVTKLRNMRVQRVGRGRRRELYDWLGNNPRHSGYIWAIYTLCYLLL